MKVPGSRAAARNFETVYDHEQREHLPVEPDDPGRIHAYLLEPEPRDKSEAQGFVEKQAGTALLDSGAVEAACGMGVRVVYAMAFDTDEPEACRHCVRMTDLWKNNSAQYRHEINERHQRWQDIEDERNRASNAADLARQERYGSRPIDDD